MNSGAGASSGQPQQNHQEHVFGQYSPEFPPWNGPSSDQLLTQLLGHSVLPQYGTLTSAFESPFHARASEYDLSFQTQAFGSPLGSASTPDYSFRPNETPGSSGAAAVANPAGHQNGRLPDAQVLPNLDGAGPASQAQSSSNKRRRTEESSTLPKALRACNVCKKAKTRCLLEGPPPCKRCAHLNRECIMPELPSGAGLLSVKSEVEATSTSGARPSGSSPSQGRPNLSKVQVQQLFSFFFARLNTRWALLHPEVHTPSYCKSKSALLFWTVCYASSCYLTEFLHLREQLGDCVHRQVFDLRTVSSSNVETVQGLLYLSLWGTGMGKRDQLDLAWLAICFACRSALDMRLYLSDAPTGQHHNIQRTWMLAWIIDRTKSIQRGRISTIQLRPEETIRLALEWSEDEPDLLFQVMYSELLNVTSKTLEQLSEDRDDRTFADRCIRMYSDFADGWLARFKERSSHQNYLHQVPTVARDFHSELANFYTAYWSLAVFSFAVQNAIEKQTSDLGYYCLKASRCAEEVLRITDAALTKGSPMQESPDGHWEFILHAAVFLLKLESPELRTQVPGLVDASTETLIERVASLLSAISTSPRDTPILYCSLLRSLLRLAKQPAPSEAAAAQDQTVAFASSLIRSEAWRNVVLPGINAGVVEAPRKSGNSTPQ